MSKAIQCDVCEKFEGIFANVVSVGGKSYEVCSSCLSKFEQLIENIKEGMKIKCQKKT